MHDINNNYYKYFDILFYLIYISLLLHNIWLWILWKDYLPKNNSIINVTIIMNINNILL